MTELEVVLGRRSEHGSNSVAQSDRCRGSGQCASHARVACPMSLLMARKRQVVGCPSRGGRAEGGLWSPAIFFAGILGKKEMVKKCLKKRGNTLRMEDA